MIVLFISIIAIAITILLYYKNPAIAPLRIFALIILCLLITNFTINIRSKEESNPPAVLIDCSASMARELTAVIQHTNNITFSHSRFFFSESLSKTKPGEGRFTNITNAISEVSKWRPSAILLISDGNHNYGKSPLSVIDELDIPIYCFGVGSALQKDLAIAQILYPEYAFKQDSIKIEVIVQSKGFDGGEGEIKLKVPSRQVEQNQTFPLSDVIAKQSIDFMIFGAQPGEEIVHIYLVPQPGEGTYENNELDFSLHILEKKISVLYYTDHLSFNTKFMLRALNEDKSLELVPFGKVSKGRYLGLSGNHTEKVLPSLNGFDVLVLDNVNLKKLFWHNIKEFLNQGKGILCMGSVEGLTNEWRDILPIDITGSLLKGNHHIKIIEPFSCLVIGDDYPPFSIINRVIGIKENVVIIAKTGRLPIIAYRNYGNGMVFQINVMDIGTWQFLQVGLRQKNLLSCLVGDIVRFLSPLGKKGRLVLKSLQKNYIPGEMINLTLQSFDRDFKPKGDGDFYIEFEDVRVPFFEVQEGTYEATFVAKKSGAFELRALGKLGEEILKSNTLTIRVSPQSVETEQGLNSQLLKNISEATDGKYYSIDELRAFQLPESKERYVSKKIYFNSPIMYFVIFILLAIDWVLRRRRGII